MKKIRIIICLLTILLIAVAFSVVASATDDTTVAYRYTKNGVTVEAEHVDGENDLSHIVELADAGTTVYVLKDIEMASGSTSESPLISVKKNLTIDLGGNTLTIKQNGKNYIRTYNNVTATWQNGTINAARMDNEGYAHPLFRFPNMASPTLNLININSYTGGLIANRTGQSVTVNIEGGEHHLVLKNDTSFNSMIFSLSGTNLTAKNTSFYVGSYNLLTAMSSGATDGNPNHNYTFTDCDIIGVPTTSRLVGYANQYVNVAFNGCNIVGGLKTPQLFSWDSNKSIGAIESGAITLGAGTCLASGASIDTTGVVACAANAIENAVSISKDFTLNYSSGTVFDGNLAIAESTKTFDFATEYIAIDYSYTKDGETVKAKHVDGTMDLSHIVGLADADTTVYVHSDIEMANGSTSKSALINVTKNLTIDLGGNTLTIKQNGQNYINTASNATATWQNGEIIAAYATENKAASAYPVFSFFDATNPTLNIINVTSYTGGLIGNRTSKSVEVNIEGGEHHFAFKNDMNFTSIIVATSGTELNAKDTSFYLGASASNSLLSALSNSNPDEPYCNHTYTFTNCNVIGASNASRLVGYANQYVKVSFIGCKLVGGLKIPNLHSFDSDKSITAAESGAITLGEGTYISAGAVIDTTGIVVYDGEARSINVDKGFKLYYASGDLYSGFTTKKSTKYFNFTQKVIDPNNVPKTEETLIDSSTSWKYLDDNTDPAAELDSLTAWTLPGFDDSAWKTGVGSFGTKSGALAAVNGKTPTVQLTQYKEGTTTNIPAYFFRTTVNIEDVSEISYIYLHVFADDGVAVYVNGTLMLDTRASTGSTTNLFYSEYTSSFESTLTINSAELLGTLVDGENTIAVELHNGHGSSSDLYFGMEEFTVYYKQEDEVPVTQVILGVGSDETERSVSWLSTSTLTGDVRVTLASEVVDDTFPEDCESFEGVSTPATNKGGYFALDAVITGLKENTAYAYQIVMENGTSDIFYFNTGSFGDYSFIFVGDPQIKTEAEGEAWGDTLDKLVNEFDSEIIISAGDQIVTPSSEEQYGYFVKDTLSSIAFAPSVGPSHDDPSKSFADHFYTPNASASYGITTSASNYWYVYNNTLFMHLNMADTSASTNGEHESFMRETMAKNPDVRWNIVVMHSSLYSTGMHGDPNNDYFDNEIGKYRPALAPLFTELGIDAILSGHDHIYLRTKMMDGEAISSDTVIDNLAVNPEGALYLCASSSTGSKFYEKQYDPDFAAYENYEKRKSAIYFTVTDTTLTLTSYFLDDMTVFDTFTIYKGDEDGVSIEWYDTDGTTLLGTTTSYPTLTAEPDFTVNALDGWLNVSYSEWISENGTDSMIIPTGVDTYAFTLKENSAAEYTVGTPEAYINYSLYNHFEINFYIPKSPDGITVNEVLFRDKTITCKSSSTLDGAQYDVYVDSPGINCVDASYTLVVEFTYNGESFTYESPLISIGSYCKYVLEENSYSAETKTLIGDMLRYVIAAKAVSGTEVSELVTELAKTAPTSEIPALPSEATGVDMTALMPYINMIQVYYHPNYGGVNLLVTPTESAISSGVTFSITGYSSSANENMLSFYNDTEAWATTGTRIYDFVCDTITVTAYSSEGDLLASGTYSYVSYMLAVKDIASDTEWALLEALYAYGTYSKNFIKL